MQKIKFINIFQNLIPILAMIGLILLIKNDYTLTIAYIIIIGVAFVIKYERNELAIFSFGFVIMMFSEYLFVSTGVETFNRKSLLGMMPVWLPFLWGYGFVAIKRSVKILDN